MCWRARVSVIIIVALMLLTTTISAFHVHSILGSLPRRTLPSHPRRGALFSSGGGGANDAKPLSPSDTTSSNSNESSPPPPAKAKDYSGEASALFGMVRVPAALFAGASTAAAFALPITPTDTVVVGFVKRLYALLMLGALSSQLLAIVVSTTAMAQLSYYPHDSEVSLDAFMRNHVDFEWVTTLANFFFGMLAFVLGSGIRAWISIGCPVVARAALGIIVSATLLAIAFLNDSYCKREKSLIQLPIEYATYLVKNARKSPLFGLAVLLMSVTYMYIGIKIPHLYSYLSTMKS